MKTKTRKKPLGIPERMIRKKPTKFKAEYRKTIHNNLRTMIEKGTEKSKVKNMQRKGKRKGKHVGSGEKEQNEPECWM